MTTNDSPQARVDNLARFIDSDLADDTARAAWASAMENGRDSEAEGIERWSDEWASCVLGAYAVALDA